MKTIIVRFGVLAAAVLFLASLTQGADNELIARRPNQTSAERPPVAQIAGNPFAVDQQMIVAKRRQQLQQASPVLDGRESSDPVGATPPPQDGTDCDFPIIVNFTGYYEDFGQTTCYFEDNYSDTDMGNLDEGEDIIYELIIPIAMCIDITVDPLGTAYTGCGIFSDCPDVVGSLIDGWYHYEGFPFMISSVSLEAGTYYLMIDTWAPPECVPEFDLTITEVVCTETPLNDRCVDAIEIYDGYNGIFTNEGATQENDSIRCDVWFKYTATCDASGDGCLTFDLSESGLETEMAVYLAPGFDCSTMSLLALADDAVYPHGGQGATVGGISVGSEFIVRVGGQYGIQGQFSIIVDCSTCPDPPGNDNCADLESYYGGSIPTLTADSPLTFTGTTIGALDSDCAAMLDTCVWEAFTIDTCMSLVLDYCGTSPVFSQMSMVMESECPCNTDQSTLVRSESLDWTTCDDYNATITFGEVPAGTYYYPVYFDYFQANGPYTINVSGEICRPYCEAVSNSSNEYISRVQMGSIDNSSSGDDYTDYCGTHSTVVYRGGNNYELTVESTNGTPSDNVTAFIDWDGDLVFEHPDEWLAIDGNPSAAGPFTSTISCPTTAVLGATTLRIRLTEGYPAGPCGIISNGEVEDYRIIIEELPCGDVNDDGIVDIVDVSILIDYYFYDPTGSIVLLPNTANGDINGDGCVNIADIVMLVEYVTDPSKGAKLLCAPVAP